MDFKEFVVKSGLTEGSADTYKSLLDGVRTDMNIALNTISLNNIDGIINNVSNDIGSIGYNETVDLIENKLKLSFQK